MKKYIFMMVSMIAAFSSFAQDASIQKGAASHAGGGDNVDTIYTMILAICAAAFLVMIIYALSRAIKALSSQVIS